MKNLELKVPPLVVMLIFGICIFLLSKVDPFRFGNFKGASITLTILGAIISISSVIIFKNEQTTVDPMNPNKSNNLVVKGIYNYSRNPMYLSFYLWLLAFSIYCGSILAILFGPIFILYLNVFQIKPEEKILLDKFGESYLSYKKSVRRWI